MQYASVRYCALPNRRVVMMTSDPPDKPQPRSIAQPIRVLLISDLLLVRAGIRHLLESAGMPPVGEAATRAEARALAEERHPDVIVVDLDSRTETFECVEELVATATSSRIIALSDRRNVDDHHTLVELGAHGLILKHEAPEELISAIKKVSAGEICIDRSITAEALARMIRRRRHEDVEAVKIATLTRREHEIITLVGEGLKNAGIGERLFISEGTVRNHLSSILDKLALADRFQLAVYAFRHGLVRYSPMGDSRQE